MAKTTTFFIVRLLAYTKAMRFAKPTATFVAKSKESHIISLALAGLLIIMVVAQLFTFEDFPDVIANMWLPGGEGLASVIAAVIVIMEVFALPFLLGMRLSAAMRTASMVLGWMVIVTWTAISLWQNGSVNIIGNAGILGDTVPLPVGWWSVFVFVAIGVLMAWANWGAWSMAGKNGK